MTTKCEHDLGAFARARGYEASACPGCTGAAIEPGRPRCANCGGSGRLWTSTRGSLSDEGLARLRRLVEETPPQEA